MKNDSSSHVHELKKKFLRHTSTESQIDTFQYS